MNLAERVKSIILKPKETWEIIKGEQADIKELYVSYAAILAIITPAASFIGLSLIGISMPFIGHWRQPVMNGLVHAVLMYALTLVGVFVTAYIADMLAPTFESKKNLTGAFKAVVFSYTPAWIAGILNIIPGLGILATIAGLYSLYLLYLGLPLMMDTPEEKKIGYVVVVVVVTIVVMFVISLLAGLSLATASMTGIGPRF